MKKYRCTRNQPYEPESLGYQDLTARQGYYIHADSREEAIAKMSARFPDDTQGFTAKEF